MVGQAVLVMHDDAVVLRGSHGVADREIGHRRMRVDDLLQIAVGSVLELDTAAGAPLGIYANQTLIAQGEAVVVGEHYGVRVTEILTPSERVKKLGERR